MKLIIKELLRNSKAVIETWEKEFKSMNDCLKYVKTIDKQLLKETVKFEYVIKE